MINLNNLILFTLGIDFIGLLYCLIILLGAKKK